MKHILGIDLGTSNSLCAVFEDKGPILIPNALGNFLTPSVVGFTDGGHIIVGSPAKELSITQPQNCVSCFKRWMGLDKTVKLGPHSFSPPELSAIVLRSLKQDAENCTGIAVTDAVISVPAYFNDNQRKATKIAGELAGLQVKRILNEPTAAALTYGFHEKHTEKKILVFDLGGGTFDTTFMEIFDGTLEIISTAGESFLGGEDFTERILAFALKHLGIQFETVETDNPCFFSRLKSECENAKLQLSKNDTAVIKLPDEKGFISDKCETLSISNELFAEASASLLKQIERPTSKALRDGEANVDEIDDVILVGGATRMPVIQEFVRSFFKKEALCRFNPDEVVALGAAIQAALIEDNKAVEDIVMTDVCPFTLGINISKKHGRTIKEGYYLPIIHRNTVIPVSREETVSTLHANQSEVHFEIFQGEARKVENNLFLGSLKIHGIPKGPEGKEILVRFTYDLNGILEVDVIIPETGKKFNTVLTQHVKGLSQKDIKKCIKNMQALKFYPRDDIRNQQLLLFCERIIGEINPFERQSLESALDMYEEAMSISDRDFFKTARDELIMKLSMLGIEYADPMENNDDGN